MDCSLPGISVHGDSLGKNTGVGCHALLQGIFPTWGLNPTQVSQIRGRFFTIWGTRKALIPSPGNLPESGIEQGSPELQADSLPAKLPGKSPLLLIECKPSMHMLSGICYLAHCALWRQRLAELAWKRWCSGYCLVSNEPSLVSYTQSKQWPITLLATSRTESPQFSEALTSLWISSPCFKTTDSKDFKEISPLSASSRTFCRATWQRCKMYSKVPVEHCRDRTSHRHDKRTPSLPMPPFLGCLSPSWAFTCCPHNSAYTS